MLLLYSQESPITKNIDRHINHIVHVGIFLNMCFIKQETSKFLGKYTCTVHCRNFVHHSCLLLTHWCRVTHICVGNPTIIGSDNGLAPGKRQAIILTNAGILLIRILGTNFSEILSEIHAFSFKKMHSKLSSRQWRQFCLDLNMSTQSRGTNGLDIVLLPVFTLPLRDNTYGIAYRCMFIGTTLLIHLTKMNLNIIFY